MSTKIYDAYKLVGKTDFNSVMSVLQELKSDVEDTACETIVVEVAKKVQLAKDLYTYYGKRVLNKNLGFVDDKFFSSVIKDIINDNITLAYRHAYRVYEEEIKESWLETSSIVVIPCGRRIFAMLFGNLTYATKNMGKHFVDYHYQNQTDKPDDVSSAEWCRRERDWDKAIGSDYIPANHGLTFTLFDIHDIGFELKLLKRQDLLDKALEKAENTTGERVKLVCETFDCPLITKDMDVLSAYVMIQSEEYKSWVKKQIPKIKKKLGIK